MPAVLAAGSRYERPVDDPARFRVGEPVRTRNMHPAGHTRLPRYARGRVGVVERVHGAHVLPDANAHGAGEQPQYLYTVRFAGRELWGADADPALTVTIDAWEGYLEPARTRCDPNRMWQGAAEHRASGVRLHGREDGCRWC